MIDEEDAEKLDKNFWRERSVTNALTFGLIASSLGLDYDRVEALALGVALCLYEIKGDLFEAPWNPSGHFGTV